MVAPRAELPFQVVDDLAVGAGDGDREVVVRAGVGGGDEPRGGGRERGLDGRAAGRDDRDALEGDDL
jgi:hypothetical protein